MKKNLVVMAAIISMMALGGCMEQSQNTKETGQAVRSGSEENENASQDTPYAQDKTEIATFAGGCFWCTEADFEKLNGVKKVVSGYSGGTEVNPTYEEVSSGATGHRESIQVYYDPGIITYPELLEHFWTHIDPTDAGGQFVDRGQQYTSAIYYHNQQQKELAETSKQKLEDSGIFEEPIVTSIEEFKSFYPAEDYHQDYYKEHSIKYNFYRYNSGRDQFLKKTWNNNSLMFDPEGSLKYQKPSDEQIKEMLTPLQYRVTQEEATEKPFENEYWNNTEEGIYVDIISGEPLFSTKDQYKSGTGWPSFTKPLEPKNIVEKKDKVLFITRTEVRSRHADSHLGHVFNDGPPPTGLRYCMNSAAMRFIPKEKLEEEGYGQYASMFD